MTEWGKALRPTVHDVVKEINEFKEQTNQNIASINEGIDALQTDKANKIGYYDNLIAGAANTLFGSDTETEMFTMRTSANDGMVRIESLQGNTLVSGTLLPVRMTGVETVGFNQWDEEWELGSIQGSTGANVSDGNAIRSKSHIPVLPNTEYCITCTSKSMQWIVVGYDENKQFVSNYLWGGAAAAYKTFTTGASVKYIRFATYKTPYGSTTYNHDICINLSDPDRNGEYEPYWESTREIPVATYFPDGLRSAGDARDELTATAAVKRVGAVDLGTLSWVAEDNNIFRASFNAAKYDGGLTCVPYTEYHGSVVNMPDKGIIAGNSQQYLLLRVKDTAYTDAATFQQAMSGVMLYYELATPTTTEIDPPLNLTYHTQQRGTESIVIPTGESSAPPVLVTTQAVNADDVRDIALSQIAVIENGNASTNYSVGDYLIHSGILYRVTRAIANGEAIIAGTNVTTTTVMDELVRLTS